MRKEYHKKIQENYLSSINHFGIFILFQPNYSFRANILMKAFAGDKIISNDIFCYIINK